MTIEYRVKLTYFKASGKYYSQGEYVTQRQHLFEVWEEVREMQAHPGLIGRWGDGPIAVDVPGHPQEHPHLVMP